jgi:2-methylcitrate dehydratase PrpD
MPKQIATEKSFSERLLALFLDYPGGKIPASAVQATRLCMKDTIGVALAGAAFGVGTSGARVALEADGPAEATVWGSGAGAGRTDAALANGMLAHALDFDDTHPAAIMHASAVNIPVALAVGEAISAPAAEILSAAVLSYEISARLGRLGAGPFQDHGFQSTAVLGVFASTFIAARLLKVSPRVARDAMGIAGSMAAGLMEYLSDGTDVKQMHPGWAAQSGIRAVQLARAGLTGPATVLEGRFGVFKTYADLDIDPEAVLAFDGSRFEVEEMAPKPYPACLCVHPMVQAALDLRAKGILFRPDAVEEIHCEVPQWYVDLVFEPAAQKAAARNAYEGRFSAPFCIARAALDGKLGVQSFLPDSIADPRVAAIARKVTYRARHFAEFPETFPALLRVRMNDGSVHEASVPHNLGSAKNPLGASGIDAKFRDNVIFAIDASAADRLDAAIGAFAPDKPIEGLWAALRGVKLDMH